MEITIVDDSERNILMDLATSLEDDEDSDVIDSLRQSIPLKKPVGKKSIYWSHFSEYDTSVAGLNSAEFKTFVVCNLCCTNGCDTREHPHLREIKIGLTRSTGKLSRHIQ